jgi:hypothetical protein
LEVIVAREDGKSGGRVCEEEGSRRGVEVFEFSVEGGRTRFARKKLKKAEGRQKLAVKAQPGYSAKSAFLWTRLQTMVYLRRKSAKRIGISIRPWQMSTTMEAAECFPGSNLHRRKYLWRRAEQKHIPETF